MLARFLARSCRSCERPGQPQPLDRASYWPDRIWLAFFTGYVSHLVGDSVTIRGVKLFAPFYNKSVGLPVRWLRVRTGSKGEFVMLAVMVLPMVVWLFFW
jgi:membrane-bound metal-dependent hydrolase YbcI (DUF457 family)